MYLLSDSRSRKDMSQSDQSLAGDSLGWKSLPLMTSGLSHAGSLPACDHLVG